MLVTYTQMHRRGELACLSSKPDTLWFHQADVMLCRSAGKGKGKGTKAEAVPFKQASPMKKAPAAQGGTFYGTIGGKIPYVPVC